jgi:hypothetical protein
LTFYPLLTVTLNDFMALLNILTNKKQVDDPRRRWFSPLSYVTDHSPE